MKWFKSLKLWQKILLIWIAISVVLSIVIPDATPEERAAMRKEEKANQAKKDSLEAESNKLLEAYLRTKKAIKSNLKDPDSYKELDRLYHRVQKTKDGAEIEVVIEYTATNSFGGRIKAGYIVLFDNNLNVIKAREL